MRSSELIYAIFLVMYVCMYGCVCVRVYVSEHNKTKQCIRMSSNFYLYITGHPRMNPIDFGECQMYNFLQEYKKEFLYMTIYGVKFFKGF